jgi:photosystem II stability/assembly factor-like uncharacterized protein
MKTLFKLLLAVLLCVAKPAFALKWAYTSAPSTNWSAIASSADGTKFVAAIGRGGRNGGIYRSADSGTTWTQTSAPITNWSSIASSADGMTLLAAGSWACGPGPIYLSTNSGTTWAKTSAPISCWWHVTCSADGREMIAAAPCDALGQGTTPFLSTNAGVTWSAANLPTTNQWWSIACSADGRKLVAATDSSLIFTSTNAGASWTMAQPTHWANFVRLSADGRILVAVGYEAAIYVSTDFASSWTVTPVGFNVDSGSGAVSSADGRMWMLTGGSQYVYTSTNYATTWDTIEDSHSGPVASSADGSKMVTFRDSYILTSFITSPQLSISNAGQAITFSWPWHAKDFVLQAAPALSPAAWTDVLATPAFSNGQYQVNLPPTNSGSLFRLLHP